MPVECQTKTEVITGKTNYNNYKNIQFGTPPEPGIFRDIMENFSQKFSKFFESKPTPTNIIQPKPPRPKSTLDTFAAPSKNIENKPTTEDNNNTIPKNYESLLENGFNPWAHGMHLEVDAGKYLGNGYDPVHGQDVLKKLDSYLNEIQWEKSTVKNEKQSLFGDKSMQSQRQLEKLKAQEHSLSSQERKALYLKSAVTKKLSTPYYEHAKKSMEAQPLENPGVPNKKINPPEQKKSNYTARFTASTETNSYQTQPYVIKNTNRISPPKKTYSLFQRGLDSLKTGWQKIFGSSPKQGDKPVLEPIKSNVNHIIPSNIDRRAGKTDFITYRIKNTVPLRLLIDKKSPDRQNLDREIREADKIATKAVKMGRKSIPFSEFAYIEAVTILPQLLQQEEVEYQAATA